LGGKSGPPHQLSEKGGGVWCSGNGWGEKNRRKHNRGKEKVRVDLQFSAKRRFELCNAKREKKENALE